MAPLEDSAVSSWITDTLRSRDGKRAVGCLEIEQRFRELAQSSDVAGAAQLTRLLVLNIKTPAEGQPTPPAWIRVGAIVSCASAAVGLGREMTTEVLVPEAMKHLTARLREVGDGVALAACEAVYNIARIVRGDIVDYVPGIVEALCFLSASAMGSLQQACGVLNRLAMDLVCECRDWGGVSKPGGESLLHRIVAVTIAGLRGGVEAGVCFSLDWVSVLESSPDIGQELLEGYPELIKVLFDLVVDPDPARRMALSCLSEFLDRARLSISRGAGRFDYEKLLLVITQQCRSANPLRWEVAVEWLDALLCVGQGDLLPYTAELLDMLMRLLAHTMGRKELTRIEGVAQNTFEGLREMAVTDLREGVGSIVGLDLKRIMKVIIAGVEGRCIITRRLSMAWLVTVLPLRPDCLAPHPGLFQSLLRSIDDRDEVTEMSLHIMGFLFETNVGSRASMMKGLLSAVRTSRSLLASKFPHMLHMLCDSMGPKEACVQVCDALGVQASSPHRSAEPLDMAFSARLVYRMGLAVIVSPRLLPLALEIMREGDDGAGQQTVAVKEGGGGCDGGAAGERAGRGGRGGGGGERLLDRLLKAFFSSPPAAISLALIAQEYDLAFGLVSATSKRVQRRASEGGAGMSANASVLPQLDKLASLIDHRVFTRLRMHLLEPELYPSLLSTINCFIEMLPQSSAASKLRRTLKTASCDVMVEINRHIRIKEGHVDGGGGGSVGRRKSAKEVEDLVLAFEQVQDKLDHLRAQNREASRDRPRRTRSANVESSVWDSTMSPLEALKQLCSDNMQVKLIAAAIVLRMASQGGEVQKSLAREGGVPLLVSVLWSHGVPPSGSGGEAILAKALTTDGGEDRGALCLSHTAAKALLILCGGHEGAFSRQLLMQAGGLEALTQVVSHPFDSRRVASETSSGDASTAGEEEEGGGGIAGLDKGGVERVDLWMVCVECLTCLLREGACLASSLLSSPGLIAALRSSSKSAAGLKGGGWTTRQRVSADREGRVAVDCLVAIEAGQHSEASARKDAGD